MIPFKRPTPTAAATSSSSTTSVAAAGVAPVSPSIPDRSANPSSANQNSSGEGSGVGVVYGSPLVVQDTQQRSQKQTPASPFWDQLADLVPKATGPIVLHSPLNSNEAQLELPVQNSTILFSPRCSPYRPGFSNGLPPRPPPSPGNFQNGLTAPSPLRNRGASRVGILSASENDQNGYPNGLRPSLLLLGARTPTVSGNHLERASRSSIGRNGNTQRDKILDFENTKTATGSFKRSSVGSSLGGGAGLVARKKNTKNDAVSELKDALNTVMSVGGLKKLNVQAPPLTSSSAGANEESLAGGNGTGNAVVLANARATALRNSSAASKQTQKFKSALARARTTGNGTDVLNCARTLVHHMLSNLRSANRSSKASVLIKQHGPKWRQIIANQLQPKKSGSQSHRNATAVSQQSGSTQSVSTAESQSSKDSASQSLRESVPGALEQPLSPIQALVDRAIKEAEESAQREENKKGETEFTQTPKRKDNRSQVDAIDRTENGKQEHFKDMPPTAVKSGVQNITEYGSTKGPSAPASRPQTSHVISSSAKGVTPAKDLLKNAVAAGSFSQLQNSSNGPALPLPSVEAKLLSNFPAAPGLPQLGPRINSKTKKSKIKKMKQIDGEGPKPCNCKKSKCLKLYCECFARQSYCKGCNCKGCFNNEEHEDERSKAVLITLERDANAFFRGSKNGIVDKSTDKHLKGCNCRKSRCQKKYCECFQAGVACSAMCKCINCANDKKAATGNAISDDQGAVTAGRLQKTNRKRRRTPSIIKTLPPRTAPLASLSSGNVDTGIQSMPSGAQMIELPDEVPDNIAMALEENLSDHKVGHILRGTGNIGLFESQSHLNASPITERVSQTKAAERIKSMDTETAGPEILEMHLNHPMIQTSPSNNR